MSIVAARSLDEKQYDEYLQKYLSMVLHYEEIQLMTRVARRVRDAEGPSDRQAGEEKKHG